jgi:hypothetical protein
MPETRYNRMTVMPDRSQGGTSKWEGMIELMINRNEYFEDMRGITEVYRNMSNSLQYTHKILLELNGNFNPPQNNI